MWSTREMRFTTTRRGTRVLFQPSQAKPSRNPLVRFHKGFERVFEAIRAHYRGLLDLCLHNRGKVIAGFFGFTLLSFALAPAFAQCTDAAQSTVNSSKHWHKDTALAER
jgi:hypothetical protein